MRSHLSHCSCQMNEISSSTFIQHICIPLLSSVCNLLMAAIEGRNMQFTQPDPILANTPLGVFRLLFASFYDICITKWGCLTSRDVTFEGSPSGITEDQVTRFEKLFIWMNIFSEFRKILVPSSLESSSLLDIPETEYEDTTIRRRGTRWSSRLRYCTTSRKVAGSIPDVVIRICYRLNSSGRSGSLGSTHFLTDTNTRDISWGVKVTGAQG